MSIARHEEKSAMADKVCVGIALIGDDVRVAARVGGHVIASDCSPASPLGTAALIGYLAGWQSPLRLAVASAGATAIGLAITVGTPQGRAVFLVSAQAPGAASDLARYAEHAI